jgi:hypothetical protein
MRRGIHHLLVVEVIHGGNLREGSGAVVMRRGA